MSVSGMNPVLEELLEYKKKVQKERFRATSKHTEQFDPFTVYARDMPSELIKIRHNFQGDLIDALSDPICVELAVQSAHNIIYVESIMVKYLSLADVLYDDNIDRDWMLLSGDSSALGSIDPFMDTTQLEEAKE